MIRRSVVSGLLPLCWAAIVIAIASFSDRPDSERWFLACISGLIGLGSLPRLSRSPVITIDELGVSDRRLSPSLIPWSSIRAIEVEPKFPRGGALLLYTERTPHTVFRARFSLESRRQLVEIVGGHVRLPLQGLSYTHFEIESSFGEDSSPNAAQQGAAADTS